MFKLQMLVLDKWVNVNEDLKMRLPVDCDVVAWVRSQFPAGDYRMVWERPGSYELTEDQKTELWGLINEQAEGMDHNSLCQYYADHEVEDVDLAEFKRLTAGGEEEEKEN